MKIDSRSSGYEFFTVDYLALAVAMCAVASALVLVFGAWKQSQFIGGFIILFMFGVMIIPLRALIPFALIWIVLHRFHYLRPWHFLLLGGVCGLSVFVTLPEPEDPIWSLRWNDFQHMKPRDCVMLVGLAFSGCVGGCAAGLTRRFPRVNGGGWNASDLGTRQQR